MSPSTVQRSIGRYVLKLIMIFQQEKNQKMDKIFEITSVYLKSETHKQRTKL